MANTNRSVLERVAEFDTSKAAPSSLPLNTCFRSLAISSASDSQTLVYVGTDAGTLILLDAQALSFTRSTPISDSSVDSIHVFEEEIGRVLAVSDGFLFWVDSHLLQPPTRLNFPRGVTIVAPRSSASSPTSDLFSNRGQRFLHKLGANGVNLRDSESNPPNCVAAVAVGKRLFLIDLLVSSAQFLVLKEIQAFEGVKAMVWIDDSIIVATVGGYTQYSFLTGQFTPIFSLPHPSAPPYLKCLPRDRQALLLIDNVGILVNPIGHPVGGSLIFRYAPDAVGEIASYLILVGDGKMDLYHKKTGRCVQSLSFAGKGIGPCTLATKEVGHAEIVIAATASTIICFRKVSAEEQIKDLLRKKNFKEAITLVEELESEGELTRDMLSFVHAQVGFLLLFDMHFEEAIDHFLLSETMQPSEIFPFIMRDPNRWSMLVPRNRYWGLHPPPVPLEDVIDEGLMTIQRAIFLRKAGVETSADEKFIKNPPTRAYLLESAIKNVIRYLQVSRNKDLVPSVREGVDTFLMYLYRVLNHVDDMEQLASSENSCVVEELETLLDESGHLRTLAFLYASKGINSKALAIWRILARNYSVGLWKDPAMDNDPHDSLKNAISGQKAAATEASKLLEESSDQDLVLQHIGWIADVDEALAIQILTSDKRTNQLSPEEVVGAIGSKKVDILQRYLQWLIEDQDSDDAQFHTLYALSLAKSALENVENKITLEKPDASARSRKKAISDSEECATFKSTVQERLQLFLQSSDLYDPEEILDLVEGSELWLEKAILYRKLGQETLVLQILALKLEDSEAAEQYCAEIGRPDAYMQLLDMYLDPQNGKEPMFNAAVRLLHNHGESLDPRQVLDTLSPDMPLQLAADTILRMLRARVHHRCQGQIAHNLSRAINIDAHLARLEERSRHVQINDESVCDSCHARLGTKLFAMYPDDAIVCYKCFRCLGESTSVSGRNFKRDIIFKPGWLVYH